MDLEILASQIIEQNDMVGITSQLINENYTVDYYFSCKNEMVMHRDKNKIVKLEIW